MYIHEQIVQQLAKERIEEAERVADRMRAIRSSRVCHSARVRLGGALVRLGQWISGPLKRIPS